MDTNLCSIKLIYYERMVVSMGIGGRGRGFNKGGDYIGRTIQTALHSQAGI